MLRVVEEDDRQWLVEPLGDNPEGQGVDGRERLVVLQSDNQPQEEDAGSVQ